MTIQTAKDSFLDRLCEERKAALEDTDVGVSATPKDISSARAGSRARVKGKWIRGPKGRFLPLLRLKDRAGKVFDYNPLRFARSLKVPHPHQFDHTHISDLTWDYDTSTGVTKVDVLRANETCSSSNTSDSDHSQCAGERVQGHASSVYFSLKPGDSNLTPIMHALSVKKLTIEPVTSHKAFPHAPNGQAAPIEKSFKKMDNSLEPLYAQKEPFSAPIKGNEGKRRKSEEQRKKALTEMLVRKKKLPLSIASKIPPKKIIFSDSESEGNTDNLLTNKVTSKLKSKTPLFESSSSASDDDEQDNTLEHFSIKPQFEGEKGRKLFKLQKKFKGDPRFRLDSRFVDATQGHSSDQSSETGSMTKQFGHEREAALSYIDNILGTSRHIPEQGHNDLFGQRMKRYDPEDDGCADLELAILPEDELEGKHELKLNSSDEVVREEYSKDSITVESMKQKYFSVGDDFKDTFQKSASSAKHCFNFETEELNNIHHSDQSIEIHSRHKPSHYSDSSDEEEENGKKISEEQDVNVSSQNRQMFFFHPENVALRNRLDPLSNTVFMRNQRLEELESKWSEKRSKIKQNFKQRRKDSLRASKLREYHKN